MKKIYIFVILLSMGITQIYAQCYQCNGTGFSIGTTTTASGDNSFVGGFESLASGSNSFAFGDFSIVSGLRGIALGNYTNVSQTDGIAIGRYLNSNALNSYVFGQHINSTGANSITIGMGSSMRPLLNTKQGSIMFGVTHNPSLTIVKAPNENVGYLGIGTDNPTEMVHLRGKLLIQRTEDTPSSLRFGYIAGEGDTLQLTTHPWDIYSDIQGLKFNAIVSGNNIQRMVISGGGSVGIGVTTPQAKLHVGQDILAEGDITTRDKLVLSPGSLGRDSWEISRTNNGLNFVYRISSTNNNILFLDNNGHIGVGKTNPSSALDVNGTATVNELRAQSATIANALTAGSAAITGTTQLTGNVGIGTAPAQEKLNVNGSFKATNADITNTLIAGTLTSKGALNAQTATINGTVTADALNAESAKISGRICAKEVRVAVSGGPCWPDFVFAKDYKLPTLNEVEQFINENQHLPNVPSAAEVEANGIELGEMNAILLRKVEELTLYIIQMEKRLSEIESKKIVVSG